MSFIPTEYLEQQMLVAAKQHTVSGDFSGVLYGAKTILIVAPVAPTAQSVLADVTVATYTDYAPQAITWTAPYRRIEGGIAMSGAMQKFQMSDSDTPTNVYAFGLVDSGGTNLLGIELVPNGPVALADTLDAFNVSPEIALGGPDYGGAAFGN